MKVITEAILRDELRADRPEVYVIPEGKLLSPAAREYLQQLKIKIVSEKDKPLLNKKPEVKATKVPGIPESAVEGLPAGEQKPRYIDDQRQKAVGRSYPQTADHVDKEHVSECASSCLTFPCSGHQSSFCMREITRL